MQGDIEVLPPAGEGDRTMSGEQGIELDLGQGADTGQRGLQVAVADGLQVDLAASEEGVAAEQGTTI